VAIWNVTRGAPPGTYALEGPAGSGRRLRQRRGGASQPAGDLVIIATFAEMEEAEAGAHQRQSCS